MFFNSPLSGKLLPDKKLCFTYDDGPWISKNGTNSLKLAEYLAKENVFSTFFVLGKHAKEHPTIVKEIHNLGHLIGSHGFSHINLLNTNDPKDIINDLSDTASLIYDICGENNLYFRPPMGMWWDGNKSISNIPKILNSHFECRKQTGPVLWDIDGRDWEYWNRDSIPKQCADGYLSLINQKRHGILLMHDALSNPKIRDKVKALELAKILIPELKEQGFNFTRLDEIPQFISAKNTSRKISIRTENGAFLKTKGQASFNLELCHLEEFSQLAEFGLIELPYEKFAIRAACGNYISLRGKDVSATADHITDTELFTIKELESGLFELLNSKIGKKISVEWTSPDNQKLSYSDRFYIHEIR
ncbi:polysaccharide deacetylase family protein [Chromobacterium vaccinii]|uniref:Polysaccharide deacetylase family protein n=1 Tax=Chromobacterium vaccinii TaxID=1108595 RepID=A0ABV0FBV7_9NEIS